jgi:two-component system, NarL family, sensor histidine kinase UhpB
MSVTNIASGPDIGDVTSPGAALRLRRPRFAAWHWLSLRAQLLIVFILVDLIAAAVAGGVVIMRARTSTRVEIAASMNLAEALVAETIRVTQQQSPANALSEARSLRGPFMRHVRISVRNAADLPLMTGPAPANADADRAAPAWFTALIAPPVERRELPIIAGGQRVGSILITGEASDEVAEVWENTLALATAGSVVNIAVIMLLYALFGRVLKPLTGLAHGLHDLERRNYRVRLARPGAPELGAIADRFNALAQALDALRGENNELNRRVITAQDDERRRTALELHDEVGPCLFGLKANASSIAALGADASANDVKDRARDMLAIVDHLQTINRSMLNRLRPMALGHVPLGDLIAQLVTERAGQQPQTQISFAALRLRPSYGDSIDLTVYRCVQESLTNALRHANATHIAIALDGTEHGVQVTVRDDGCGIDPSAPPGRGLRGMQERVQALGGSFTIESAPAGGTRIEIAIPVKAADMPK